MIKTTGAELKRFYNDDSAWPTDSWYDEASVTVEGIEWEENTDRIPDSVEVKIYGGTVYDLPSNKEISLESHFKRWRKKQTTVVFSVECEREKLSDVIAAIKAAGGKPL